MEEERRQHARSVKRTPGSPGRKKRPRNPAGGGHTGQEFLADLSRKIRTPLAGVIGMTDLVLSAGLSTRQRQRLEVVRSSAQSLQTFINDVVDFWEMEQGAVRLAPVPFRPRACMQEVLDRFEWTASRGTIALKSRIDPQVPEWVEGDCERFRQILAKLIGNALRATERGSVEIDVSVRERAGNALDLEIAVRDTGAGMPADLLEWIRGVLRLTGIASDQPFAGTGLGLAVCARLVQMMGGAMEVESEPGRGSTFRFTARLRIPKEGELRLEGEDTATPPAPPALKRMARLLLAEDNGVNRLVTSQMLSERGYEVDAVASGVEALDRLEERPYDALVLDVQMPGMNGFDTTARIRERERGTGRHLPIVALTAHAMLGDRERCIEAGMDEYLSKPVRPADLYRTIERTLWGEQEREKEQEKDKGKVVAASRGRAVPSAAAAVAAAAQTAAVPVGSGVVLDHDLALARLGSPRMLVHVAQVFPADVSEATGRMRAELTLENLTALRREAQTLKGALAMVGARASMAAAERLEMICREGKREEAGDALHSLEAELDQLFRELGAIRRSWEARSQMASQ